MAKEKAQWAVGFEGAGRHLTHITLVREELATIMKGIPGFHGMNWSRESPV